MNSRLRIEGNSARISPFLLLPALPALFPESARATEVGCFCTALFLGALFLVGLCITIILKYALARFLWQVPKMPWVRMISLTGFELVLIILVFALIHTNVFLTILIYLPFAVLLNMKALAAVSRTVSAHAPALKKYAVFLLFPLALPASIQVAGALGAAITSLITFSDLRI